MPPSKKKEEEPNNVNELLDKELAGLGLTNLVKLAEDLPDMDVVTVPTGLPQLDYILHRQKPGFPLGRDVEVFSKDPEVGKSSISLHMLKAAQDAGLRTCIVDVEKTITQSYLDQMGIITDPFQDPNIVAVRIVRHEDDAIPAEDILQTIRGLSKIMDVIVVDSVAALESKAELEKEMGDPSQVGGLSKILASFTRKNVAKRACIIWINQTRQKVGGYNPTGQISYVTTGGRSLPFYASIRIALSLKEKITVKAGGEDEVVGMKILVKTEKNKVSPQYQQCVLTYLFGEGFSSHYDYFEMALKLGAVTKKSGWFSIPLPAVTVLAKSVCEGCEAPATCPNCNNLFPVAHAAAADYSCPDCGAEKGIRIMEPDEVHVLLKAEEFKCQGELKFVKSMKENKRLFDHIRSIIDGGEAAPAKAA